MEVSRKRKGGRHETATLEGLYAIVAAVLVVGLLAFGVPENTLLFGGFLLVCPLMMMVMMGGMHGGHDDMNPDAEQPARTPEDQNQDPIVRR